MFWNEYDPEMGLVDIQVEEAGKTWFILVFLACLFGCFLIAMWFDFETLGSKLSNDARYDCAVK